jgi:hypothetical protein
MGETTRLTHGQREQHFRTALEMECALAELPALREQFLAALARKEESLRAQHTRYMAAATTGEDPEARPHQQGLFKDSPSSAPSQAPKRPKPALRKEEQPDPEPPKGAARPRPRASTEAKGTRRAEKTASARTVAEATPMSADDDAVPAPGVPCCTCGDSLADHMSLRGTVGACHAKKCPAKPRCKAFQLGRVLGWTLNWMAGWKDTKGQPVFYLVPPGGPDNNTHGPLFPEHGGLICPDPTRPGRRTDALKVAREKGTWSHRKGVRGVPLRVLEVVARVLAAPALETAAVSPAASEVLEQEEQDQESPTSAEQPPYNRRWELSDSLSLEVTAAGTDKARLWVLTRGKRGKACRGPFVLDAGGSLTPAAAASDDVQRWQASEDGRYACGSAASFLEESEYARAAVAHLRPSSADTESTCDGCGHTFKASQLQPVGPEGAQGFYCASCRAEQEAQDAKPEPPAAPAARPHAGAPVESSVQLELGGSDVPKAGDPLGLATTEEVGDLKQVRRVLKGTKAGSPLWARLRRVVAVLVTSAREESWSYLAGDEQWRIRLDTHTERGEVWLSHGARALGTAGPWLWDGQTLTRAEDWEAPHTWPLKGTSAVAELTKIEISMEAALAAQAESPAPPPQEDTGGTWRVELPERLEGRRLIVPVWLVNEALGERRAASWWGTDSGGLKPSHHISGELRGAALDAHAELRTWWVAHAETVVKPLEQACRDGAVPGLRVGVPSEPLADGPFFYSLFGGWRLETWERGGKPTAHLVGPDGMRDGPFHWDQVCLVSAAGPLTEEVDAYVEANDVLLSDLLREAEDFITRGFVHELRGRRES